MKKTTLSIALLALGGLSFGTAQAASISDDASFGTDGSSANIATDGPYPLLSVDLWGSTAAGMNPLNILDSVDILIEGSVTTEGTATNDGTAPASGATANVSMFLAPWAATQTSAAGMGNVVFAPQGTNIIAEALPDIAADETVAFGPTSSVGDGPFMANLAPGAFLGVGSMDYQFTSGATSFIQGTGNFSSSFSTASYGKIQVTYNFTETTPTPTPTPPPNVPVPGTLLLLGAGMLGFAGVRIKGKKTA